MKQTGRGILRPNDRGMGFLNGRGMGLDGRGKRRYRRACMRHYYHNSSGAVGDPSLFSQLTDGFLNSSHARHDRKGEIPG